MSQPCTRLGSAAGSWTTPRRESEMRDEGRAQHPHGLTLVWASREVGLGELKRHGLDERGGCQHSRTMRNATGDTRSIAPRISPESLRCPAVFWMLRVRARRRFGFLRRPPLQRRMISASCCFDDPCGVAGEVTSNRNPAPHDPSDRGSVCVPCDRGALLCF